MIKTNDTTYNIAKSVKCLVIKSHLSFFFKEDKVAFSEKKKKNQMDTLKYLSIIIKICFIYLKKTISIITFKEMISHLEKCDTLITLFGWQRCNFNTQRSGTN